MPLLHASIMFYIVLYDVAVSADQSKTWQSDGRRSFCLPFRQHCSTSHSGMKLGHRLFVGHSRSRPYLIPGTYARPMRIRCKSLPEYGLPGAARPVYCLFHKKGTMIRINKEPSDVHSNSDTPQTTSSATARFVPLRVCPDQETSSVTFERDIDSPSCIPCTL